MNMSTPLFDKRKCRLFGLTIVALILMCSHFALADPDGVPKMVLKERAYDFGEVKGEEAITHTFEIRNEGDGVLTIKKVSPG